MTPVVELSGVSKDFHGLRPLRIERLTITANEQVALLGLDAPMAEVLINLITGATLPDRGEVRLFGRASSAIEDSADWLATIDRFGIVSERAVLLEGLSPVQNLAMPFTLEIEPPSREIEAKALGLARELKLPEPAWHRPVAELGAVDRLRLRVARALALEPGVLLLEHASAGLSAMDAVSMGALVRDVASRRGTAVIAATADGEFAAAVASRVLVLDAASGRLDEKRRRWWRKS